MDFLLEIISLGVMADKIRANIDCRVFGGVGHFGPKFHVEEDVPHQLFVHV